MKYHVSVISNHAQLNINVCIHISDWRGDGYILTEIQQNTYSKKGPIFKTLPKLELGTALLKYIFKIYKNYLNRTNTS